MQVQEVHQPDELNTLKELTKEFIDRLRAIDNEIETLKEDRKELIGEYAGKLDMKTLTAALRVLKIEAAVQHKNTYDSFLEVLRDPT